MKSRTYLVLILFVGLIIGLSLFLGGDLSDISQDGTHSDSRIPSYALDVLEHVRRTGKAPNGYVGGRTFYNREQLLPKKEDSGKKIKYREWDVHKKVKDKNRGAERLVTGSDDSAYYTSDHYRSFIKIQENSE